VIARVALSKGLATMVSHIGARNLRRAGLVANSAADLVVFLDGATMSRWLGGN